MKKRWIAVLCLLGLLGLLCLSSCGAVPPAAAADGAVWSEDWVTVGNVLGVETPEGMTLRENNDALSAKGMYYATWSMGEAEEILDGDGEAAQIYDAQVYLLLAGYDSTGKAEAAAAEWLDMASEQYDVETTGAESCNGQTFTVITHTYTSEANPYARGASAFGVYGNYAVSVELSCREGFDGDTPELLTDFLERCHYAA